MMSPNVMVGDGERSELVTLDLSKLSLLSECVNQGFTFEVIAEYPTDIFRVGRGSIGLIFQFWPGFLTRKQKADFRRLVDKCEQKAILQAAGLPVPPLHQTVNSIEELDIDSLPYPVVAKPRADSFSRGVFTDLRTADEVCAAVSSIIAPGRQALVERHVEGAHYRLLCVGSRLVSCIERRPASIVGDGVHTIDECIDVRNEEPARGPREDLLKLAHPLVFNDRSAELLRRRGYTLETVLSDGERLPIQDRITGDLGTDFIDVTDRVHPETAALCERFARDQDLSLVGFDFITSHIDRSCRTVGAFNEINVRNIGTSCSEHCNVGTARPVSKLIWESVPFDEIAASDYPLF